MPHFPPINSSNRNVQLCVMDKKKVRDYMTYDVVTVDVHATVKDVIETIQTTKHDGFPVTNNSEVVGYISARDLLFVHPSTPVERIMSTHLIVADPDMSINDAARVIFRSGIQKLPVVDETNKLLGIISNADVIRSQNRACLAREGLQVHRYPEKSSTVSSRSSTGTRWRSQASFPPRRRSTRTSSRGRMYEIKKGLAEPLIVVKRPGRFILVDGHHRAIAAKRLGITHLEAYIIEIDKDIELGMERTARAMNLSSLDDIKVMDYARHPLVALTHRLVRHG